ncbi:hypothetical protein TOPH_08083 [Tolypocladium ophioglossoides CBS 100239]|uniref:Protein kinase domain-containing protein n=1 Tax=Tolypocladium ophioglossoides (strain CBS 100239) TaxID=1163406 RepID=A0A0L0MZD2_TOLOC|nr:hypothetical protein TOPH_08083 [Tolypocladium ophioglossoides CBS 100239]
MPTVKLIDFNYSVKVGDALSVDYGPYVRQHRELFGGVYGNAGPVTEQFVLGSVFWYMARGSKLYSELEVPDQVHGLLDGIFPATDAEDPIDKIIEDLAQRRLCHCYKEYPFKRKKAPSLLFHRCSTDASCHARELDGRSLTVCLSLIPPLMM